MRVYVVGNADGPQWTGVYATADALVESYEEAGDQEVARQAAAFVDADPDKLGDLGDGDWLRLIDVQGEPSFKVLVVEGLSPTLGVNPPYGVVLRKEACARARVVIGVTTTGRAAVIKDNIGGAKTAKWGDLR
jgi:hypothetical protein